jgi:hypothetical protein
MSHLPHSDSSAALARLRERLEQAEIRHEETMRNLRAELEALEARLSQPAPPPLPSAISEREVPASQSGSAPVEEVVLKALREAKKDAIPPPRPRLKPTGQSGADDQVPPAPPDPAPSRESDGAFERQLGQIWLVRIGIVLLITGLVLGANWAYRNWIYELSAGVRLVGLYICSFLIGGAGVWLGKKEAYRRYGEVLVAGGLAFFYYCTFAAHQVPRLRVIESPVLAGVLLLGSAGLIAAVSWFRGSRPTAILGIALASYATMVQPLGWLSAASNLMLAAVGIGLMLRPGWAGPGIATLLGTYAAFGGWQIFGAAGHGGDEKAALWFLPGSWAIFAIPGMMGHFRTSLGERGRAFFTAANNALFFLTFTWVWKQAFGLHDFWRVPVVFGAVLLVLGLIGRKRSDTAAASNVIQAFGFLTLALIIKLEGHHLVLALAGESLALAFAFYRFRQRAEYTFSLLAGIGAVIASFAAMGPYGSVLPVWSGGLATIAVAGAAFVFRLNVDRPTAIRAREVRSATSLLAYSALGLLILNVCLTIEGPWRLPLTALLSLGFGWVSLRIDRDRWMPELAWSAGVLGVLTALLIGVDTPLWGDILTMSAVFGSCILWHCPTSKQASDLWLSSDPFDTPRPFAWLFSILLPLMFVRWVSAQYPLQVSSHPQIIALAMGAVGITALARFGKASRLEITTTFLNIISLLIVLGVVVSGRGVVSKVSSFAPAIAAAAMLVLALYKRNVVLVPQVLFVRSTLLIGWAAALIYSVPNAFIDLMALSAGAVFLFAWKRNQSAPFEAWGWTIFSVFAYGSVLLGDPYFRGFQLEGIALIALLAGIALRPPIISGSPASQAALTAALPWIACTALTIWSSHLVIDQWGWRALTVLWTILGFGFVTFGLILNRITSRKVGFILLAMSLAKLFVIDVWQFNSFMRIVSFVALGLAMVLLGFFYHRFVPAMKKLLDDDSSAPLPKSPHDSD